MSTTVFPVGRRLRTCPVRLSCVRDRRAAAACDVRSCATVSWRLHHSSRMVHQRPQLVQEVQYEIPATKYAMWRPSHRHRVLQSIACRPSVAWPKRSRPVDRCESAAGFRRSPASKRRRADLATDAAIQSALSMPWHAESARAAGALRVRSHRFYATASEKGFRAGRWRAARRPTEGHISVQHGGQGLAQLHDGRPKTPLTCAKWTL